MTAAIDVALPYYGDVELMKQAVRSVLAQTFQDWRLVVVDDGYPDPEPARWFATITDPRVIYQRNTANLGANGNYRKCLTLATAPHLVVMGADDIMLPEHLQVLADVFAAAPHAAVVHTAAEVINEHGTVILPLGDRVKSFYAPSRRGQTSLTGQDMAVSLLRGNWTYFPSIGWRTDTIRTIGFRTGLDVVQDLALLLDVAKAGNTLIFDPRLAFRYRRHSEQDSTVRALDGRRFTRNSPSSSPKPGHSTRSAGTRPPEYPAGTCPPGSTPSPCYPGRYTPPAGARSTDSADTSPPELKPDTRMNPRHADEPRQPAAPIITPRHDAHQPGGLPDVLGRVPASTGIHSGTAGGDTRPQRNSPEL